MISLKKRTRKTYQAPFAGVSEVDLEGLICMSAFKAVYVDEIRNVNADNVDNEPLYFEF